MSAGRKPVLTVLCDNKKDRYTKKQLEARAAGEPKGCSSVLSPPSSLTREAKKEWRRVVKLYHDLDVDIINDLDIALLTAYCESWAIYIEAQKKYSDQPLIGMVDGRVIENPYLKIMRKEGQSIAKYVEQLCMSPVGRARMGVLAAKKEEEDDPMEAVLKGYER